MKPRIPVCSRRAFLHVSATVAAGAPWVVTVALDQALGAESPASPALPRVNRSNAKVAIVPCRSYGAEVRTALKLNIRGKGFLAQPSQPAQTVVTCQPCR